MHYYTDIITHGRPFLTSRRHWWEQVNSTVIEFHLSNTSGSRRARTRIARLVDRDSNNCAISPPPISCPIVVACTTCFITPVHIITITVFFTVRLFELGGDFPLEPRHVHHTTVTKHKVYTQYNYNLNYNFSLGVRRSYPHRS